jgi:hypothetical protein
MTSIKKLTHIFTAVNAAAADVVVIVIVGIFLLQ